MPLLSEQDRQVVARHLAGVTHPVTLLLFTQTIDAPETAAATREILQELSTLNDHVAFEEVNVVLERERAAHYGIDAIPAIVLLRDGEDTRIRFCGAPAGFEFMSLVEAVLMAGTGDSGLAHGSRTVVAAQVLGPVEILVFVTPTCPHCPQMVTLAQRLAVESPHVRAVCVDATEFLDRSRRYRVTGVPKTVINDTVEILGAVPEDEFIRQVVHLFEPTPRI